MFFDLTKEIKLDPPTQKLYCRLRLILWLLFFSAGIGLAFLLLFSSRTLDFSFSRPATNKGSVLNPRTTENVPLTEGVFPAQTPVRFDAALVGNFSRIKVTLSSREKPPLSASKTITLRKSYQAFLYPEGAPLGFPDGTLLKNGTEFFLVSQGTARPFLNTETLLTLGFSPTAFIEVSAEELAAQPRGKTIMKEEGHPPATLFLVSGEYYQLKENNVLEKFLSPAAFLSRHDAAFAVSKQADFLQTHSVSPKSIGFADGTLIAYANSVYIVSGEKIHPIGDPEVFVGQGYLWEDVLPVSGNEFAFYHKESLFGITSPHPDGTVFFATDSSEWFLIQAGQKHRLPSKEAADQWSGATPIEVRKQNLEALGQCQMQKGFWGKFSCEIKTDRAEEFLGNYYEFTYLSEETQRFDHLNLRFAKSVSRQNLKLVIFDLWQKLKLRYGLQTTKP